MERPPLDPASRARELRVAVAAAVVLVLARSIVPLAYEQVSFDSDQAIVGLMARHLAGLKDFPLFFYGQNYMLGVQAWIAAPLVWIAGATVTTIRLPLLVVNAVVAWLLVATIARCGARPALAFVAALPFVVTTPVISLALYATLGASVEPFLYILGLWALRRRPTAFGALLCLGSLHREFTILALPALAAVHWIERRPVRLAAIARGVLGFAVVWLAVDALKIARHAGPLTQEAQTINNWLSFDAAGYLARSWSLIAVGVPALFGGRRIALDHYSVNSAITVGSGVAGAALAVAALVATGRVIWIAARGEGRARLGHSSVLLYVGLVGIATLAVYGLNGRIDPIRVPLLRYVLFGLLVPVAIFGAFAAAERSRVWLTGATVAMTVWAAFTLRDNALLFREYRVSPPPDEFRVLADYLVAHRIQRSYAMYWDCYIVDFLAGERVIVASTDFVRIDEYQKIVDADEKNAASIERAPCASGTRVASWCVTDPLKR